MADAKKALENLLSVVDLTKLDTTYPDLDRAYRVLKGKQSLYNSLWDYYDGDQPLMYAAARMADLFDNLELATFNENWCAVVVDAANDKINLSGVSVKDSAADTLLKETWDEIEANLEASDVHEAALVIGESYLIIWPDEEDDKKPDMFYNDPRLVHLFYQSANPKKKKYAAKWWVTDDDMIRITLYYPDKLKYFISTKTTKNVSSIESFVPYNPGEEEGAEEAVNPYGEVPIFHFRPERRKVKGDLTNAIPGQNAINKLLTDMMVAAEYGAFKQRYIISNADVSQLQNAPGMIWGIPIGDGIGQGSEVGEFSATELTNYIKAIDHCAASIAVISRTPKHYLMQQGGDPSGEALIASEAPLNKRCEDHINKFKPVWKDAIRFLLKVAGKIVKKDDIEVTFDKPESILPKTEAEIRTQGKAAGIPLKTLLRDEGKTEAWMDKMEKDKAEEDKANENNLGAALAAAMRGSNNPAEQSPTE